MIIHIIKYVCEVYKHVLAHPLVAVRPHKVVLEDVWADCLICHPMMNRIHIMETLLNKCNKSAECDSGVTKENKVSSYNEVS